MGTIAVGEIEEIRSRFSKCEYFFFFRYSCFHHKQCNLSFSNFKRGKLSLKKYVVLANKKIKVFVTQSHYSHFTIKCCSKKTYF